jgi:hypothetical protein
LAAEGRSASEIGERVGCVSETARRQRAVRYEREGLEGLRDRPKSGRPATHDQGVRARLIALACTRPPDTEQGLRRERWTLAELAEAVGMSVSRAQAILAQADLRPHLTEQWVMSELSPEFDAQAADVFATDCGTSVVSAWPARLSYDEAAGGRSARGPGRPGGRRADRADRPSQLSLLWAVLELSSRGWRGVLMTPSYARAFSHRVLGRRHRTATLPRLWDYRLTRSAECE